METFADYILNEKDYFKKAETAIQLTTQITTRAVNAYKEIMQMNI